MPDTFDLNDAPHFICTFTVDAVNTDPTTITLTVTDPDKTATAYTYGGSTLTKTSTGVYTRQITLNKRGVWLLEWASTGTCIAAATQTVTVRS